jgi:hypothetical protein
MASLGCSILGSLGALTLLALAKWYGQIIGATAGVGSIFPLGHAFLAAIFCFLGVVFGLIALARIGSSFYGGRTIALAGIALGCLPLVGLLLVFVGG